MQFNYVVLDVETGGYSPKENPITQLAFTILDHKLRPLVSYNTFIKPYADLVIKKDALDASLVTMQQVNNGKLYNVVLKEIKELFKKNKSQGKYTKLRFVAHNADFDFRFMTEFFAMFKLDILDYFDPIPICTQRLAMDAEAHLIGSEKLVYKLFAVCERFGIELKSAHGAEYDVDVTTKLLVKLLNRLRNGDANVAADSGSKRQRVRDSFRFEM